MIEVCMQEMAQDFPHKFSSFESFNYLNFVSNQNSTNFNKT